MSIPIIDWLFGTKPAIFESSYSLEESVERLSKITKRLFYLSLTQQGLVGKVSPNKVAVSRIIPFFGNGFKPFFKGTFQTQDNKVVLRGNFTMHLFVKLFMAFWFGFCIVFTLAATNDYIANKPANGVMVLTGLGFLLYGFVFLRFAQWISRFDTVWISAEISRALSSNVNLDDIADNRSWWEKNWKWFVPVVFLVGFFVTLSFAYLIINLTKTSTVYISAMSSVKSNTEIVSAIGQPIKDSPFFTGHINIRPSGSGTADYIIPISGPKGKATVYVEAVKEAGEWKFLRLDVFIQDSNKPIHLLTGKSQRNRNF